VVQISLYYFDLCAQIGYLKTTGIVARLLQSLSVASIIMACLYYLFPELLIGRRVFFILALMMGSFFFWRLGYFYLLKVRGLNQKILIIESGSLARTITEKTLENRGSGHKKSCYVMISYGLPIACAEATQTRERRVGFFIADLPAMKKIMNCAYPRVV